MAKAIKKGFPKIHFYDQDVVDAYNQTWVWIKNFWKDGTSKNKLSSHYFNYPENKSIHQLESIFATFFLVYSNRAFPVTPLMDNFYSKQEADGAIRGVYLEKDGSALLTKENPEGILPPLFAWAEFNMYHKIGLKKRIREIMPNLEKYYYWVEKKFKSENGLYAVPLEATGMTNSPRQETHYPIDFNAQQAVNALYMSHLGDIMNDKEKSYRFKKHYFSIKTRVNSLMWNEEDGFYYDLDKKEKQLRSKNVAAFWTLLAEIPNKDRGDRIIEHLNDENEFCTKNPFPSLPVNHKCFEKKGHGYRGSVFPHLNFVIIKGLEKYYKYDLARDFAIHHLYNVLDCLNPEDGSEGHLWEAYQSDGAVPAEWPKNEPFPRKNFLAYAALSTITLIVENILGLDISLPRKTVDWVVPDLEIMGIEDLSLKRNMITIMSSHTERGWEIRLESEKLYYFTIDVINQKKKTLPIPSGKCSILLEKL